MALSDHAGPFAWAGAGLAVYAGASFAVRRGWVRGGGRLHKFSTFVAGMLVQRAILSKLGLVSSIGPGDAAVGSVLRHEVFYVWLPVIAISILFLAISACVVAVMRRRRRRGRAPPRVPGRRGHLGWA
ncbi:hypothetical protein ACP70R_000859 [Stipagrostis hirtigluma subsp. patula]